MQKYSNFQKRINPILEARKYAEFLARESVFSKAQVAQHFSISRARVVQYLNLRKLPKEIQDFLVENDDVPEIKNYFTERRLRGLTGFQDFDDIFVRFGMMVEETEFLLSI
jgi:predicted transcriptional regulator